MMAQIFVGKDSLVSDAYPMQSSKQFVNILEDNIRFRGAMTMTRPYSNSGPSQVTKDT